MQSVYISIKVKDNNSTTERTAAWQAFTYRQTLLIGQFIRGSRSYDIARIILNWVPHTLELHYHGDSLSSIFSGFRILNNAGRLAPDIYNYGLIYINDDFTQFTIALFTDGHSGTWSPSDGLMITAPAKDRVEDNCS